LGDGGSNRNITNEIYGTQRAGDPNGMGNPYMERSIYATGGRPRPKVTHNHYYSGKTSSPVIEMKYANILSDIVLAPPQLFAQPPHPSRSTPDIPRGLVASRLGEPIEERVERLSLDENDPTAESRRRHPIGLSEGPLEGQASWTSAPSAGDSARGKKESSRAGWFTRLTTNKKALINAVQAGNVTEVERLLDKGADLEWRNSVGCWPLALAARLGDQNMVELLLEAGALVDSKSKMRHRTPLSFAASSGHVPVVEILLRHKAAVNAPDCYYRTPLSFAAGDGHKVVVELLLENGAAIDFKDFEDRTPLSYAVVNGHQAVVELLLQENAFVDPRSCRDVTPLSFAARHGHEAMVRLLLSKHPVVDSKDGGSNTPLKLAAMGNHTAVCKLLLGAGADIKKTGEYAVRLRRIR